LLGYGGYNRGEELKKRVLKSEGFFGIDIDS